MRSSVCPSSRSGASISSCSESSRSLTAHPSGMPGVHLWYSMALPASPPHVRVHTGWPQNTADGRSTYAPKN